MMVQNSGGRHHYRDKLLGYRAPNRPAITHTETDCPPLSRPDLPGVGRSRSGPAFGDKAMVCNLCVPRSRRTPHENHRAHIAAAFVRPRRQVLPNLTEASSRSPVVTGMDNGKRSDRWRITPRKSATYETKPSNFESSRRPLTPSCRKNCVPWPSSSKSAPRNWRCADRSGCRRLPAGQWLKRELAWMAGGVPLPKRRRLPSSPPTSRLP
jgi:hypothetical protein